MVTGDNLLACWERALKCQVEELIHAMTAFEFARNDGIVARVEQAIQGMEEQLQQFASEEPLAGDVVTGLEDCGVDSLDRACLELLAVEAHQLLAKARQLLAPYRRPRLATCDGEAMMQPLARHTDLTDAEFERLLAASDIPVLGGGGCSGGFFQDTFYEDTPADSANDAPADASDTPSRSTRGRAQLVLVSSDRSTGDD